MPAASTSQILGNNLRALHVNMYNRRTRGRIHRQPALLRDHVPWSLDPEIRNQIIADGLQNIAEIPAELKALQDRMGNLKKLIDSPATRGLHRSEPELQRTY